MRMLAPVFLWMATLVAAQQDCRPPQNYTANLATIMGRRNLADARAKARVTIQRDETVYSAALRACYDADRLQPDERERCIIPLAKWLQTASPLDGAWLEEGAPEPAPDAGWAAQLPRNQTRRRVPCPPPPPTDAAQLLEYGFASTCPPLWVPNPAQRRIEAGRRALRRAAPFGDASTLASRQGLGFFGDADEVWSARVSLHRRQLRKQLALAREYPATYPAQIFFQMHWEPTWSCLLEERVGPAMDGGKWLCDPDAMRRPEPEQPGCLVYSVGSEKDTGFERAMVAEHGCEVHTFDHSVEPRWVPPPYLSYHRVGLGAGERMASLPQMVEKLGHTERVIDVLKIDCEGCEYALLPLLEDGGCARFPPNIRQVLIEVHATPEDMAKAPTPFEGMVAGERTHRLLQGFARHGFAVFHKEPNIFAMGGQFVEYALVRLDLSDFDEL